MTTSVADDHLAADDGSGRFDARYRSSRVGPSLDRRDHDRGRRPGARLGLIQRWMWVYRQAGNLPVAPSFRGTLPCHVRAVLARTFDAAVVGWWESPESVIIGST
jgi:hypothetical protein